MLWSVSRMLWPSHVLRSVGNGRFGLTALSDLHLVAWTPPYSVEWLHGVQSHTNAHRHKHNYPHPLTESQKQKKNEVSELGLRKKNT